MGDTSPQLIASKTRKAIPYTKTPKTFTSETSSFGAKVPTPTPSVIPANAGILTSIDPTKPRNANHHPRHPGGGRNPSPSLAEPAPYLIWSGNPMLSPANNKLHFVTKIDDRKRHWQGQSGMHPHCGTRRLVLRIHEGQPPPVPSPYQARQGHNSGQAARRCASSSVGRDNEASRT